MSTSWRNAATPALLLGCGVLALCGCATTGQQPLRVESPEPPSEEIRAQFGIIAIVADPVTDPPSLEPRSKGKALGTGALDGTLDAFLIGSGGGLAGPYGLISGLFLAPVGGIIGSVYGEIAGMSKAEFLTVSNQLADTVRELALAPSLAQSVAEICPEITSQRVFLCTNGSLDARTADADLPPLAAEGAQTRLDLQASHLALMGLHTVDPPLTLHWFATVRLVRVSDGTIFFAGQFHCQAGSHTLREWTANKSRALKEEIARARPLLANQIAEELFVLYPIPTESRFSK